MNLALPDSQIDSIVGDDAGKALDDPAHLDRQRRLRLGLLSHLSLHSCAAGLTGPIGRTYTEWQHCNRGGEGFQCAAWDPSGKSHELTVSCRSAVRNSKIALDAGQEGTRDARRVPGSWLLA